MLICKVRGSYPAAGNLGGLLGAGFVNIHVRQIVSGTASLRVGVRGRLRWCVLCCVVCCGVVRCCLMPPGACTNYRSLPTAEHQPGSTVAPLERDFQF